MSKPRSSASQPPSLRQQKIVSQIRRLLADIFRRPEIDLGEGLVTVNDIVVSRDLASARVWVSFTINPHVNFKKLVAQSGAVQTQLYKSLPIRKVPKLIWQLLEDPTAHYRIDQILDDIKRTHSPNTGAPKSGDDRPAHPNSDA